MPEENRALRLKESAAPVPQQQVLLTPEDTSSAPLPPASSAPAAALLAPAPLASDADPRVTWNYFDERGYVERGGLRPGEDPYTRNRFNQDASDRLASNRDIPDERHPINRDIPDQTHHVSTIMASNRDIPDERHPM
uniref:Uncharacterized protein n=1 Tax=Timema genevievae TaxID=629358 RepID=A0A7R9JZ81_TIMGE|nr:unnamed protein product [Timema genevievae]